ncbi:MAG TPA: hypothetical protein VEH50_10410 [Methylomirabilota bacterium]|nr:hypothetical protein [Methylomirabilota bacterium]
MKVAVQNHDLARSWNFSRPFFLRPVIVLLLLGVAGLSTIAKVGQYYPRTSSAHYISFASKMDVAHPPAVLARKPIYLVARITPPEPAFRVTWRMEPEPPLTQRICIVVSLQHRSPPLLLA